MIAGVQAGQHPGVGGGGEVLRAAQQDPADAVERVALAAAMSEGLLLDPAADVIDGLLGQSDSVEGIQHDGGLR